VWQKTKQKLLPTPANFHYVFNLKDLLRIWEGMLQICTEECSNNATLLKLWCHEIQRVIFDKLASTMDKNWFMETVKTSSGDFLIPEIFQLFSDDMSANLFVRDVAEETGDEPDDYVSENPKIYEHIDK
jgi:dynein heavy chain